MKPKCPLVAAAVLLLSLVAVAVSGCIVVPGYATPAPVYVAPQPVYVTPQPVYLAPAPAYVYGGWYWHRRWR